MIPIVGLLLATDRRGLATIDAVAERLTDDHGLVYRYRADDGLDGEEGALLICTFWLAQPQAMAGRLGDAIATFETATGFANDVGLLSQEVDSRPGSCLAFSHIGLVNAAWAIAKPPGGEGVGIARPASQLSSRSGGHQHMPRAIHLDHGRAGALEEPARRRLATPPAQPTRWSLRFAAGAAPC
jgi:hypothetical protein